MNPLSLALPLSPFSVTQSALPLAFLFLFPWAPSLPKMTSPASCGRPAGKTRGSWHHPQGQLLLQAGTHKLLFYFNQHFDFIGARTEGTPKLRGNFLLQQRLMILLLQSHIFQGFEGEMCVHVKAEESNFGWGRFFRLCGLALREGCRESQPFGSGGAA